jgi:acyl carrier protein
MAAADARTTARLERVGLSLLETSMGVGAIEDVVDGGWAAASAASVVVAAFDWPVATRAASEEVRAGVLREFASDDDDSEEDCSIVDAVVVTTKRSNVSRYADVAALEAMIAAETKKVIGDGDGEGAALDRDAPLMASGLDSLGAVELRGAIAAKVLGGVDLPATLLFDYPTIAAVATHLHRRFGGDDGAGGDEASVAPVRVVGSDGGAAPRAVAVADACTGGERASSSRDAVAPIPRDRWDVDARGAAAGDDAPPPGSRFGGFISTSSLTAFDHDLLGVRVHAEAMHLDPRQRVLVADVSAAWTAAATTTAKQRTNDVAVFTGVAGKDYALLLKSCGVQVRSRYPNVFHPPCPTL